MLLGLGSIHILNLDCIEAFVNNFHKLVCAAFYSITAICDVVHLSGQYWYNENSPTNRLDTWTAQDIHTSPTKALLAIHG